jgi:two-component system NarL family response regulator
MPIKIAIAEDQRMVREVLAAVLAREPDMAVVGQARTGPEAIHVALAEQPDLLVLDIGLPELDGLEVARTLKAQMPDLKVLALSVHTGPQYVRGMLRAGAAGYVDKSSAYSELVDAIRTVTQNRIYLSAGITREALGSDLGGTDAGAPATSISMRERQVLKLLAEGGRSTRIASELNISVATVEAHRRNIMRKLSLHTVADLTRYAVREGLVSP